MKEPRADVAADAGEGAAPPDLVHVLIKFTGALEDLEAAGFEAFIVRRHPTLDHAIASGRIAVDDLAGLEDVEHLVKVEGSRPVKPELDRSLTEARIEPLHSRPLTGADVIVGVIDSGFDVCS